MAEQRQVHTIAELRALAIAPAGTPPPAAALSIDQLRQRIDQLRQRIENERVHLLCSPEDVEDVRRHVDQLPGLRAMCTVRSSPFLEPGRALLWQGSGDLAPPGATPLRVPRSS